MHQIFFLARIFPYWALPLCLVLGQLAALSRRRRYRSRYPLALAMALLIASCAAWIFFRGDLYSDDWVRAIFGI